MCSLKSSYLCDVRILAPADSFINSPLMAFQWFFEGSSGSQPLRSFPSNNDSGVRQEVGAVRFSAGAGTPEIWPVTPSARFCVPLILVPLTVMSHDTLIGFPNHSEVVKDMCDPSSFMSDTGCTLETRPTTRTSVGGLTSSQDGYVSLGVVMVRSQRPLNDWAHRQTQEMKRTGMKRRIVLFVLQHCRTVSQAA